jgi:prophage tail gpP-like protein
MDSSTAFLLGYGSGGQTPIVTVKANGRLWTAWRRVMVRAGMQHAAREFQIVAAAESGAAATAWAFKAGTSIDILFDGKLACRGYVDRYQPRLGEHKRAEITISGRSTSQDFIDSSAVHDTGQFKNMTPQEIGAALDHFGVGVSSDEQLDKVPVYRITPGETAFRCVEKLCREQGVFVVGQADGSIKLTKGGKLRHAGGLVEGINIKEIEADHNWSGRHSDVIVRGQRPYGHGEDALQVEGIARDAELGRYRPVIVIHDGDTDTKRAKKRAGTRRDREAANALKAEVTVQGFFDPAGTLWEPGALVFTDSDFADIHQDMGIEQVEFSQDRDDGSLSVLSLVDPKALGGKGSKGGSAGGAWASDAGDD